MRNSESRKFLKFFNPKLTYSSKLMCFEHVPSVPPTCPGVPRGFPSQTDSVPGRLPVSSHHYTGTNPVTSFFDIFEDGRRLLEALIETYKNMYI